MENCAPCILGEIVGGYLGARVEFGWDVAYVAYPHETVTRRYSLSPSTKRMVLLAAEDRLDELAAMMTVERVTLLPYVEAVR